MESGEFKEAQVYLEIYFLANEQNGTIIELWAHLKVTFRRCFDHKHMLLSYEIYKLPKPFRLVKKMIMFYGILSQMAYIV
jgi:hypothetical protein